MPRRLAWQHAVQLDSDSQGDCGPSKAAQPPNARNQLVISYQAVVVPSGTRMICSTTRHAPASRYVRCNRPCLRESQRIAAINTRSDAKLGSSENTSGGGWPGENGTPAPRAMRRANAGGRSETVATSIRRLCTSGRDTFATAAATAQAKNTTIVIGTIENARFCASSPRAIPSLMLCKEAMIPTKSIAVVSETPSRPSSRWR